MAIVALGCALALSACGGRKAPSGAVSGSTPAPAAAAKELNLYIWSDYLAANTLPDFEKQTGIKVHAAYYDSNETLETKLLAGSSGYDVWVAEAS
jgi:putrescine transport system substrate-binding protein